MSRSTVFPDYISVNRILQASYWKNKKSEDPHVYRIGSIQNMVLLKRGTIFSFVGLVLLLDLHRQVQIYFQKIRIPETVFPRCPMLSAQIMDFSSTPVD